LKTNFWLKIVHILRPVFVSFVWLCDLCCHTVIVAIDLSVTDWNVLLLVNGD